MIFLINRKSYILIYREGREIGYIMTGTSNGYIPNATMSWGAQLYKGYVFYSDWNSWLGASKVSILKHDTFSYVMLCGAWREG